MYPRIIQRNYEGSNVKEPFQRKQMNANDYGRIICPVCKETNGSLINGKCIKKCAN